MQHRMKRYAVLLLAVLLAFGAQTFAAGVIVDPEAYRISRTQSSWLSTAGAASPSRGRQLCRSDRLLVGKLNREKQKQQA